ncbi:MAG: penicillin-binding protein activator [Sneathiellales bacterium]|nr:penicillin-binding protein activator [Sneathiellales bacterium]
MNAGSKQKFSSAGKTTLFSAFAGLLLLGTLTSCQTIPVGQTETPTAQEKNNTEKEKLQKKAEADAKALAEKAEAQKLLNEQLQAEEEARQQNQPAISLKPPIFADTEQTVKIAIMLPLTGQHAAIGNDLLKAAYMALFDHNNKALRLMTYDTKGTPEGAKEAALLATGEGAKVIVGPLFASSVEAIRPIAAANNINMLAFSTNTAVAGDGVYLMGLTAGQQIDRVMEYSYRQGLARFAVLAPSTPYGDAVVANVQQAAARLGLSIDKSLRYPADLPPGSEELQAIAKDIADFDARAWVLKQEIAKYKGKTDAASKTEVKRLKKLDTLGEVSFEALIIPEGGQRLRELAPLLSYYDVDPAKVQFIGTGLWADRALTTEPALVGGWFAAPDPAKSEQFLSRFKSLYGYVPPRIASLSYDATALIGLLALEEGEDKFGRLALENRDGFAGYNGVFRFPTNGIAERGLAVMQVGGQDLELIEEAPAAFDPLIN